MSFTGIRDLDREILLRIESERDLLNVCSTNKYALSLCNDTFFMNRIIRKYPGAYEHFKKGNKKWKEIYLHLLKYIDKLNLEYDFFYQRGDPKLYYDILSRKNLNAEHAIEVATMNNLPDLVNYFIQKNDPYDIDFNASLVYAVAVNNRQLVNLFLSYGASFYDGALLEAAKNKNVELVEFFLEKGANINEGLCGAVISEDWEWIEYFIKRGANNWSYAVTCSLNIELADKFIQYSEKDALPINYLHAMNNAARNGKLELLKFYYDTKLGGNVNKHFLHTIFNEAVLGNSKNVIEILEYLKSKGFNNWSTALYMANQRRNDKVIQYVTDNYKKRN